MTCSAALGSFGQSSLVVVLVAAAEAVEGAFELIHLVWLNGGDLINSVSARNVRKAKDGGKHCHILEIRLCASISVVERSR